MTGIIAYTTINKRKNNEDCCNTFVVETSKGTCKILLLADGMGGLTHGELISREVIINMGECIAAYLLGKSALPEVNPDDNAFSNARLEKLLCTSIEKTNKQILRIISANKWPGGGSTIAGVIIKDDRCIFGNLGDSMIYHWSEKEKKLRALCNDHSVAGIQYMNGAISQAEAMIHPYKNHLVYYVGMDVMPKPTEIKITGNCKIEEDDIIFLCSDGVNGKITLGEMDTIFKNYAKTPENLVHELIEQPRQKKETDNQSLIIFKNRIT